MKTEIDGLDKDVIPPPGVDARRSARSRFAWNLGEVSGSLGDLGTFLPHIVGAITIVGMDPTGILTTFGLFYAFSGTSSKLSWNERKRMATLAEWSLDFTDAAAFFDGRPVLHQPTPRDGEPRWKTTDWIGINSTRSSGYNETTAYA